MIPPQPLQPLGIGDIIDRSIRLYKSNFFKFIAIVALPQALAFLASSLITFITYQPAGQTGFDLAKLIFLLPAFVVAIVSWWIKLIALGALVRVVSEYYLGRLIPVKEALGFILNKWGVLLGAIMLSSLMVFGGFLLLIIPGIILFFRYIFIIPVATVEDLGVRATLKRSAFLSKGFAFKFMLIGLCYTAIVSIFSLLVALPFSFLSFQSVAKGAPLPLPYQITQNFLQQILELVFSPFWMVALTLLYYDSRIRKEGFDLQIMAQHLGYEAPAPAAPSGLYPQPAYATPYPAQPAVNFPVTPPGPGPYSPIPPPPPPLTSPSPPSPPGTAFNPSPFGAKTCPQCGAPVPNISPKCQKCGTAVPFKPRRP